MTAKQNTLDFGKSFEVWDDQALARTFGRSDAELRQRMLQRFASHTGKQLHDLSRLCEQGDFYAIGNLAHNAKTSALTVGAMQLGHFCDLLESSCAEGDEPRARMHVADVLRAYEAIQTYLPQPAVAS
jgi:HPt (histidine-containing phosphotransfer) domain-containing protein